jgi:hypothetical protein
MQRSADTQVSYRRVRCDAYRVRAPHFCLIMAVRGLRCVSVIKEVLP